MQDVVLALAVIRNLMQRGAMHFKNAPIANGIVFSGHYQLKSSYLPSWLSL